LEKFAKTASSLKNVRLANNQCLRFEDSKTKVLMADIVLCINSIYFLRGWSKCDRNNPILKQGKNKKGSYYTPLKFLNQGVFFFLSFSFYILTAKESFTSFL